LTPATLNPVTSPKPVFAEALAGAALTLEENPVFPVSEAPGSPPVPGADAAASLPIPPGPDEAAAPPSLPSPLLPPPPLPPPPLLQKTLKRRSIIVLQCV
jgi:hypothetical protein